MWRHHVGVKDSGETASITELNTMSRPETREIRNVQRKLLSVQWYISLIYFLLKLNSLAMLYGYDKVAKLDL